MGCAAQEAFGTAGGHAVPVLADERPDQGDVPGARADEGVPHGQAPADVTLRIGRPMRRAVGPEQARFGQSAGVPGGRS